MPKYNLDKMALLRATYGAALREAVSTHPEEYPWYPDKFTVDNVVERMMSAVHSEGIIAVSITGRAWELTRKELGLTKKSYKAWEAWLNDEGAV